MLMTYKNFGNISLFFVKLPVLGGGNLEMFKNINVRVLPDALLLMGRLGALIRRSMLAFEDWRTLNLV